MLSAKNRIQVIEDIVFEGLLLKNRIDQIVLLVNQRLLALLDALESGICDKELVKGYEQRQAGSALLSLFEAKLVVVGAVDVVWVAFVQANRAAKLLISALVEQILLLENSLEDLIIAKEFGFVWVLKLNQIARFASSPLLKVVSLLDL